MKKIILLLALSMPLLAFTQVSYTVKIHDKLDAIGTSSINSSVTISPGEGTTVYSLGIDENSNLTKDSVTNIIDDAVDISTIKFEKLNTTYLQLDSFLYITGDADSIWVEDNGVYQGTLFTKP